MAMDGVSPFSPVPLSPPPPSHTNSTSTAQTTAQTKPIHMHIRHHPVNARNHLLSYHQPHCSPTQPCMHACTLPTHSARDRTLSFCLSLHTQMTGVVVRLMRAMSSALPPKSPELMPSTSSIMITRLLVAKPAVRPAPNTAWRKRRGGGDGEDKQRRACVVSADGDSSDVGECNAGLRGTAMCACVQRQCRSERTGAGCDQPPPALTVHQSAPTITAPCNHPTNSGQHHEPWV